PRGEHDDGHGALLADEPRGLPAVHHGHHQVHDDEVGAFVPVRKERIPTVAGRHDLVAGVLQIGAAGLQQVGLVVYHQDFEGQAPLPDTRITFAPSVTRNCEESVKANIPRRRRAYGASPAGGGHKYPGVEFLGHQATAADVALWGAGPSEDGSARQGTLRDCFAIPFSRGITSPAGFPASSPPRPSSRFWVMITPSRSRLAIMRR